MQVQTPVVSPLPSPSDQKEVKLGLYLKYSRVIQTGSSKGRFSFSWSFDVAVSSVAVRNRKQHLQLLIHPKQNRT